MEIPTHLVRKKKHNFLKKIHNKYSRRKKCQHWKSGRNLRLDIAQGSYYTHINMSLLLLSFQGAPLWAVVLLGTIATETALQMPRTHTNWTSTRPVG